MHLFYHSPLLAVLLVLTTIGFCSNAVVADIDVSVEENSIENILLGIEANEDNSYSDIDFCDDEEIDEDALPDNVIEQLYSNARMAFLFGQYEIAFKAWQPLAEDGYAKAQAALAWMYHTGNGIPKNTKTAFLWYTKAAKQGHAIAQNNLAVLYEKGLGTHVNTTAAAAWYRDSADSGYSFAQYNIGRMYAEGRGLKQDIEEAKYWWRIASRQGVKKATESLALLESTPGPEKITSKSSAIAHAPYHSSPVAKGLAWIEQQQRGHYTIQLARSKDIKWILKLAASDQLEQQMVQFKSKDAKGVEWHNLIYGSFPSYQKAESARKQLPESFRKWSPWLRRFGEINQILLK
ncbi:SEL1-like repeat protein [Beggiatoa alba]|nr:SEL1-like repeat protein [Beggiatoa alba]